MINLRNIKHKIMTDDKFAITVEYLMSKVVFENPINPLKFVYKNHLVVKGKNNKFSIYELKTNKKLYGGIYLQDVAKYIISNIDSYGKVTEIIHLEKEYFRHLEKLKFFTKYYEKVQTPASEAKLSSIIMFYNMSKNDIVQKLYYS